MDELEELNLAQDRLIDALGRQSAFWGVGKITGELYAVLYLAAEPLSLGEVAAELKVSKGNVSMAIRVLEQLGMVKRIYRRGDKRIFFEAETDFWQIAHRVLERRNKPEFDESFQILKESVDLAQQAHPSQNRDFILARLQKLNQFYDELDSIVTLLQRLDPHRISRLVQIAARLSNSKGFT